MTKKPGIKREDRPGHLDPSHAASLRAMSGGADGGADAAFTRPQRDGLAAELGASAVGAMTSGGDDVVTDDLQADVEEEAGGPFVGTTGGKEFAAGTDASNPEGAEREPFPKA